MGSKEIKPVNLKGNPAEYSLQGQMLKLQYFGHPIQRADSLEKIRSLERLKVGGERGPEDEMVGWHHRLNGQLDFEQAWGSGEGQGSLLCCCPWGND